MYWRRRIIALLGLIVILGLIGKLFFGSSAPQAAPTTSPKPTSTGTPTTRASHSATPTKSSVPVVANNQTKRSVAGTCRDGDVKVMVTSAKHVTSVGGGMNIKFAVKNISKRTCTRDLGSGVNEVTITSGPALVWSTDHCNPSTASDVQTLKAGQTWSVNIVWDGHISAGKCQILGNATHGAYWVHAHNGKVQSKAMRFVVN